MTRRIAESLGVESFAEAIGLIEKQAESLGQAWEDSVIIALTDSGPAGEAAAQRVQAAYEESNATISQLERDRQTLIANGQADQLGNIDSLLSQERRKNGELQAGVGWLDNQAAIADGLGDRVTDQQRRQGIISGEYRDQARSAGNLATDTAKVKTNVNTTRDLDIKAKVDTREIDNLPSQRNLTINANVQGATAKAQRLIDAGVV